MLVGLLFCRAEPRSPTHPLESNPNCTGMKPPPRFDQPVPNAGFPTPPTERQATFPCRFNVVATASAPSVIGISSLSALRGLSMDDGLEVLPHVMRAKPDG